MRICPACGSSRCDDSWSCEACGGRPASIDSFLAFAPHLASTNDGFQEDLFSELAALEAGNFWFRARNDLIVWAMRSYAPGFRTFLEVGCGTGFVLSGLRSAFPSADLSGSEIFAAGLRFAADRVPTARLYQMDARSIPFRDEFDVVGAFDVIEHIEQDAVVITEIGGALRPGGVLLLTVPQHPALWSPQDDHAFHVRRYTQTGLRRRIEAAGLEVVRMTSFVSLLLPMLAASRLRMRLRGRADTFDVTEELRHGPVVNRTLERVMRIELALIRRGVSFPAGGSLLAIARKPVGSTGAR